MLGMSDLIDRQNLLNNLRRFAPEHFNALVNDLILKEPSAQQWIPCSERLPEYGESVLCYFGTDEDFGVNHIIDEEDGEWFDDGVTAWMPLPEPPYKENSDG